MALRTYQECMSMTGWQPVIVRSHTDPNTAYRVDVNPWRLPEENICECPAYLYRGSCRHQREASEQICGWSEDRSQEPQTDKQRLQRICPRCTGATRVQISVEEDE